MTRYSPYSTSGLKKIETDRQRLKARDLTLQFADERQALLSILKSSPAIKAMHEWMGEREISAFKPQKFGVKKPVKDDHEQRPAKPAPSFMDRLLKRSTKIEQDYQERCARVDAKNAAIDQRYDASVAEWEIQRSQYEADQTKAQQSNIARVEHANQKIRDVKRNTANRPTDGHPKHANAPG